MGRLKEFFKKYFNVSIGKYTVIDKEGDVRTYKTIDEYAEKESELRNKNEVKDEKKP